MRKKAEKAIRKFIPERRSYLQQRAVADAEAAKRYPELPELQQDVEPEKVLDVMEHTGATARQS